MRGKATNLNILYFTSKMMKKFSAKNDINLSNSQKPELREI